MERDLSPGYQSRFRILESPRRRRLCFPEMDLKSLKLLVLRAFGTISNCITRGSFFRPRNRLGNLHFWRGLQGVFVGLQSGGQWRGEGPSAFGFFDGPKLKFSINSSTSSSDPPIKVKDRMYPFCNRTSDACCMVKEPSVLLKSLRTNWFVPTGNW